MKHLNTDQAVAVVADAIAAALRKISPTVQVITVEAPAGQDGVVEFVERDTEREWYIAIQLNSDPTGEDDQ